MDSWGVGAETGMEVEEGCREEARLALALARTSRVNDFSEYAFPSKTPSGNERIMKQEASQSVRETRNTRR